MNGVAGNVTAAGQVGPLFEPGLRERLERARAAVTRALLHERGADGHWVGELSSSALSTATAVTALTLVARQRGESADQLRPLIRAGRAWLVRHQNADGGWGDTGRSRSNISTSTLVWAALGLPDDTVAGETPAILAAEGWLVQAAGSLEPTRLVAAIERRYGDDRTFSIPILTMSALCGRLGEGRDAWRHVQQLPFEVAALPQAWFGALRLPVVSYALPALIAMGQVRHGLRPTTNPLLRALRNRCRAPTLRTLTRLQPENGGFLEATPLTAFVTMSLAALGHVEHPVVRRGVEFLVASMRPDGSWPIDTNLATWVTSLSLQALAGAEGVSDLDDAERRCVRDWLLGQQCRTRHPYTLAAPGGWAWTNLPGGVPDADDTPGAILALLHLDATSPAVRAAVEAGVRWLLGLQNRDGGIPTFCRGWGRLPFDRSSPDITAHTVRAWQAARPELPAELQRSIDHALARARRFLLRTQRPEGAWCPLWFGHQDHPAEENPLYGTARVLPALSDPGQREATGVRLAVARALDWLVAQQTAAGGWSGAPGAAPSVEETGLALEALAAAWGAGAVDTTRRAAVADALQRGGAWLAEAIERDPRPAATPIGFYFAKLWYFERLYPLIFAAGALNRLTRCR
jgi:squalene-hopene/tetraprenyl-beta-curcumene cyclase